MYETVVDWVWLNSGPHKRIRKHWNCETHFFSRAFQHHFASEFRLVPVAVFFGSKNESSKISSKGELWLDLSMNPFVMYLRRWQAHLQSPIEKLGFSWIRRLYRRWKSSPVSDVAPTTIRFWAGLARLVAKSRIRTANRADHPNADLMWQRPYVCIGMRSNREF